MGYIFTLSFLYNNPQPTCQSRATPHNLHATLQSCINPNSSTTSRALKKLGDPRSPTSLMTAFVSSSLKQNTWALIRFVWIIFGSLTLTSCTVKLMLEVWIYICSLFSDLHDIQEEIWSSACFHSTNDCMNIFAHLKSWYFWPALFLSSLCWRGSEFNI